MPSDTTPRRPVSWTLAVSAITVACATQQPAASPMDGGSDAVTDISPGDTQSVSPGGIPAPRPTAPLSTAIVNTRQPTFRWVLPQGTDGADVQVCVDRACNQVSTHFTATGTSAQPASPLPPGVFYWRLRGTSNGVTGTVFSPTWQAETLARNARAGGTWGGVLDINGDGIPDLTAGAPGTDPTMGSVNVYVGSSSGYAQDPTFILAPPPMAPTHFGTAVASGGDLDGNGFTDLVVGAPSDPTGDTSLGAVYIYPGSLTGIATMPALSIPSPALRGLFGFALAGVGDVNGDGYADLAVGAPGVQIVYVFNGGPPVTAVSSVDGGGPDGGSPTMIPGVSTIPSSMLSGTASGSRFGTSVAGAGDVNGDGFADLVVGDPGAASGRGAAYIYLGSAHGPLSSPIAVNSPDASDVGFGSAVAGVGDVNGDGLTDIAVGAPGSPGGGGGDAGPVGTGRVYVYYGNVSAPAAYVGARLVVAGSALLGASVAGGGDVNGDGNADIIVGGPAVAIPLPSSDGGTDGGVDASADGGADGGGVTDAGDGGMLASGSGAWVFLGGAGAVNPVAAAALTTALSGTRRGWAVAIPGDFDGDLLFDLAVAEPSGDHGAGQVTVHRGGMTGVTVMPVVTLTGASPTAALGSSLAP